VGRGGKVRERSRVPSLRFPGDAAAGWDAKGRRTWKFQKCAPVQLAYPPNWRVMTSPSLDPIVARRRAGAQ